MRPLSASVVAAAVTIAAGLSLLSNAGCADIDYGSSLRRGGPDDNAASSTAVSSCGDPVEPLVGQRLTKLEYDNVIRDLFGVAASFSDAFSDPPAGAAGFTTESTAQNVSGSVVLEFYRSAEAVADAVFARNPNPLLSCGATDECAHRIIGDIAPRAFRRPLTAEEDARLFGLFKSVSTGGTFADAARALVTGILLSPQFIFRTFDSPADRNGLVPLGSYELASRLSFFLWGSIPDDALRASAADDSLLQPDVLRAHVDRMLKNPKAASYLGHFASQWVGLHEVDTQVRSTQRFPQFDGRMRESMVSETLAFMNDVVASDRSVIDFVAGKFTFVDSNVSKIYGLPGTFETFTRVALPEHRSGILTQPAILTLTSGGDATSVVRRGKWVLERLLCSAPPPPPPDVPISVDTAGADVSESKIRERMAAHRAYGSTCISCHQTMDPIGFTFESFDSIGTYRTKYIDDVPVDASGELPSGERLTSVTDLAQVLARDPRFPSCFTARLSSFASGQDLTAPTHRCVPTSVAQSLGTAKTFSEVVRGIVTSELFVKRAPQDL